MKMVHCNGCGFNVEPYDARQPTECTDSQCDTCRICEEEPRLREAYRRGFNAGLDRLAEAVTRIVKDSALRKRP
jgi:hypothetical protein